MRHRTFIVLLALLTALVPHMVAAQSADSEMRGFLDVRGGRAILGMYMDAYDVDVAEMMMMDGIIDKLYEGIERQGFLEDMREVRVTQRTMQRDFPFADEVRQWTAETDEFGSSSQDVTMYILRDGTEVWVFYAVDVDTNTIMEYIEDSVTRGALAGAPIGFEEFEL